MEINQDCESALFILLQTNHLFFITLKMLDCKVTMNIYVSMSMLMQLSLLLLKLSVRQWAVWWYAFTWQVISHRGYKCREDFDDQITAALEEAKVDVVCLAGFMRILSGKFVTSLSGQVPEFQPIWWKLNLTTMKNKLHVNLIMMIYTCSCFIDWMTTKEVYKNYEGCWE